MNPTPTPDPLPQWVEPPAVIAARERMREIFARLDKLLATRIARTEKP